MSANQTADPPSPGLSATPTELAERLCELRRWAGQPSLRRLRQLGGVHRTVDGNGAVDALPESTTSYVLRGDRPASAEFVRTFVAACLRARERAPEETTEQVERWHDAWLRAYGQDVPTTPAGSAGPAVEPPATVPAPRQLPREVGGFTGRIDELADLDTLLSTCDHGPGAVSLITGAAGVGKTALAVRWAHRVADRFPDGQLYVNLQGYDPHGAPMPAIEAVRGFLDALQVPAPRIPDTLEAQAALYRSLLAGRRMVVVLDDARDATQVRPLLPGTGGCLALVTSRDRLSGLVAAEGAHPVPLDLLTTGEARELLGHRLGAERVAVNPDATDEIIDRCARLPLALAVVAARAAAYPGFPLRAIADELAQAECRLDAVTDPDTLVDVRAAFACSYRTLGTDPARLFRLLALHPGPDLSVPAAASLAGIPLSQARGLLAELARAHLVTEHAPGRYAVHDLLDAYAAELTETADGEAERHAARRRVLDHYLHTAHTAALLIQPRREPLVLTSARPDVASEELTDRDRAVDWFAAQHAVLLAAIQLAASAGFDAHAWQLAWTLDDFLDRQGRWRDLVCAYRTGLRSAVRLDDGAGQARVHRGLGRAYTVLDQHAEADAHLRRALELYAGLGDRTGEAHTARNLSLVLERQGRYREALDRTRRALQLYTDDNHQAGRAGTLNNVGWFHALLGNYQESLEHCQQALVLQQGIGDTGGEASTWDSLGLAHHHLGQHERAVACYRSALGLYRHIGYRFYEASTLHRLGDTHHAAGETAASQHAWRQALAILEELDHPDADQIRPKLKGSPVPVEVG